ncbi:MAG: hypothetical protein MJZ28_11280 [Paludibacteraceae bacterium]|nr:hypothetical protein [Paludibacteraceae bacterium]
MNKKDQKIITNIIDRLLSITNELEEISGKITELADDLEWRYESDSIYYDDAQFDADSLNEINNELEEQMIEQTSSAINHLYDLVDKANYSSKMIEYMSPEERRNHYHELAEEMVELQIEKHAEGAEQKKIQLLEAEAKIALAKLMQKKNSIEEGEQNLLEEDRIFEEYLNELKEIYIQSGGKEKKWNEIFGIKG